jgi:excisionase family DNA binding protein
MAHCSTPIISLSERRAYTTGEAAALLGVSISTLYAERARGRLDTIKLAGRRMITREQLDAYITAAGRERPPELAADTSGTPSRGRARRNARTARAQP